MDLDTVYTKIQNQLNNSLPFVIYHKADSNELNFFLQDSNQLFEAEDYTVSGFVFAPFDNSKKAVLIPSECSKHYCIEIPKQDAFQRDNISGKYQNSLGGSEAEDKHKQLVKKGIKAIELGDFKKVVLSRKEEISAQNSFGGLRIFKKMVGYYPKAFVYYWFHPKVGSWLGATPETLLYSTGDQFSTMALAGTQPYASNDKVSWADKELEEQEMVTDFILKELSPIAGNIVSSKTYTHRAGTLLHLRTDIKGDLDENAAGFENVIKILHPTPAVCGLPKKDAKAFIMRHEGYDRKFYTGFLGELNMNKRGKTESNLFVNLRCMELKKNKAILFVGGGITKDSVPEKEWEETVRKTETMKKVLF